MEMSYSGRNVTVNLTVSCMVDFIKTFQTYSDMKYLTAFSSKVPALHVKII